jgi:hypothetical protein
MANRLRKKLRPLTLDRYEERVEKHRVHKVRDCDCRQTVADCMFRATRNGLSKALISDGAGCLNP